MAGDDAALTVDETNRLRASLGLAPLRDKAPARARQAAEAAAAPAAAPATAADLAARVAA
jgi:hypothetical protein